MHPTETMRMCLHREAWQCFFKRFARAFLEGWNVIWKFFFTTKVKRSKEPFSQQPWPNSIHEMSWFMPLPPWIVDRSVSCSCRNSYGDWREESGDESKNNSITWTKRKPSTWFSCWERKPVQEVSIILLTFQLRIVWQIFLTKSKADVLITAVKPGRLLEVEVHPNVRTLTEHEAFLSSWCRAFMHKGENVFFLNALQIFRSPASREGPFHVMFVRTSMGSESQDDATKNNVCTCRLTHLFIHEDGDIVHVQLLQ